MTASASTSGPARRPRGAAARAALWLALATLSGAAAAQPSAADSAAADNAAKASRAAFENTQRAQRDDVLQQDRGNQQGETHHKADVQARKQELCALKKRQLDEAKRLPGDTLDRANFVQRAQAAMTQACQKP